MENLNALEVALLQSILEDNKEEYPFLLQHFPLLKVKSREYTGVGQYSNFEYTSPVEELAVDALISSEKELIIQGVKNELSYVLDIANGKINQMEIVTNGNDEWDGNFDNFELK